jgi:site-specific recombinase XerD
MRNRALLAVLYGAGLRIGEALALKVSDIDVENGSIRILHGKGDTARFAGIDAGSLIHIVRWIEVRRARGIKTRHLFCTLNGDALQSSYVRPMIKRMALRAGIDKRVHPHALRHTHAVELEAGGFTVSEIQQQLGHVSLQTTQVYLNHIAPSKRIAKVFERRDEL